MTGLVALTVTVLAEDGPRNTGPDFGKASPIGLFILVLLLLGTFALVWSMNRHLRKLPESFDNVDAHGEPLADEDGPTADDAADGAEAAQPAEDTGGQPAG